MQIKKLFSSEAKFFFLNYSILLAFDYQRRFLLIYNEVKFIC